MNDALYVQRHALPIHLPAGQVRPPPRHDTTSRTSCRTTRAVLMASPSALRRYAPPRRPEVAGEISSNARPSTKAEA